MSAVDAPASAGPISVPAILSFGPWAEGCLLLPLTLLVQYEVGIFFRVCKAGMDRLLNKDQQTAACYLLRAEKSESNMMFIGLLFAFVEGGRQSVHRTNLRPAFCGGRLPPPAGRPV